MTDFLIFKSFISLNALIVFYWLGALFLPVAAWFVLRRIMQYFKPLSEQVVKGKTLLWNTLSLRYQVLVVFCFLLCFLLMELFWRMMFEFLIAYMQMHEALLQLSSPH